MSRVTLLFLIYSIYQQSYFRMKQTLARTLRNMEKSCMPPFSLQILPHDARLSESLIVCC